VLTFNLARTLGRDGVQRPIGVHAAGFDEHRQGRGFLTVLVARLIPIVPFTFVNYLAGRTAIRLRVFVAATVIGVLPATTAYVALGAYVSRPGSWPFVVAVAALVASTAAGGAAQALRRRRSRTPVTGKRNGSGLTISATPSADGSTST
jgi:uncharacterized membrane protein YdjX (TVP38/TMEM64 family)